MRRGALVALAALLAGCSGDRDPGELVVSAASSLSAPLTECANDGEEPRIRLQFGGSDELAAQIRQGVRPDVYAAADTALPEQLVREGLLESSETFATNELVIATPEGSPVRGLEDLGGDGVRLAVGSGSVPVGAYAREVLDRLPAEQAEAIRANVRSEEPDVKGILGKLDQGAADAGFVYRTDAGAASGLRAIRLPEGLRPEVAYGAGVVKGSALREDAIAFVAGLREAECGMALREAGFGLAGR
jgi:molybdate transport system substrate-binding protein